MAEAKGTADQIEYSYRGMKVPRIREDAAKHARDAGYTHEEYLGAVLSQEISAKKAAGATADVRAAVFHAHKSLANFSFDHQPGLNMTPSPGSMQVALSPPYRRLNIGGTLAARQKI